MTIDNSPDGKAVTAGVILIGDELLSGRTQDTNLKTIADFLAPLCVEILEARIISDDREVIIMAVREFSRRFDYVFTTGGIGPTHDDITAEAVAAAFGLPISEREDALEALRERYDEADLNAARRRMARIPEGASLIKNPVSQAPGFQTENVFTLAGVPQIMRAMLEDLPVRIKGGTAVYKQSVQVSGIGEGDIAESLAELAARWPDISIGSYPFFKGDGYGLNIVLRGRDEAQLAEAKTELTGLIAKLGAGKAG